jgi:ABC-2 type transport system permease protein
LTQIVIWVLTGAGGVALVMRAFPELSGFGLDLSFVALMLVTFFPAFIMVASLMAMVGSIAAEARDAQQISAIFSLPVAAPLWFISFILQKPNSPLAIGLSIFPFTAPVTLPMRGALTTLPWWQVAVSISQPWQDRYKRQAAFRLGMPVTGKNDDARIT